MRRGAPFAGGFGPVAGGGGRVSAHFLIAHQKGIPNNLAMRDAGRLRGGLSVMAALGMRYADQEVLLPAIEGAEMHQARYLEVGGGAGHLPPPG